MTAASEIERQFAILTLPGPDFHRLDRASFVWCTRIGRYSIREYIPRLVVNDI